MAIWLAAFGGASATHAGEPVERIEPAHWWVGMKDSRLQLLVHGPGIGAAQPSLERPGVTLERVIRVSNPNYLFLDLQIAPDAQPGPVSLNFKLGQEQFSRPYELHARSAGSAQRRGFDASDVIVNIVPDRFVNGDPANDNVAGYPDPANRASNSAGRHGGDIAGLVQSLDYLAGMGYTMIWPTPLTENKQPAYSYHGYAATDTYKIDPRFGSNEDYRRFVTLARQKGIGVIKDVVLNHIGSEHWWMKDLPSEDWLSFKGKFVPTQHFRTAVADPYASLVDKQNFTAGWFTDTMPDMNQRNPLVANYQIQNAIWWVEYAGLSGIRVDTYGYSDAAFLAEWTRRLMAEYPYFNMVGEEWSSNPVVVSYWLRGRSNTDGYISALPSGMDFPLNETLRRALVTPEGYGSGLNELYAALVNDLLYPDPMNMVLFEGNHDMPRLFSILNDDPALTRMALAYVLTMRGIPQLYYGTEVLMSSLKERDDGEARRDFPGGWPGDPVNAFTGAGLTAPQREMQDFVRKLMTWRRTQPALHRGSLKHYFPEQGSYVWFRQHGRNTVMVVINKNPAEVQLETARFAEMLSGYQRATDVLAGRSFSLGERLAVPGRSVMVLELGSEPR